MKRTGWIETEARHPEEGQIVSARFGHGGEEMLVRRVAYRYDSWWFPGAATMYTETPTHWKSLDDNNGSAG